MAYAYTQRCNHNYSKLSFSLGRWFSSHSCKLRLFMLLQYWQFSVPGQQQGSSCARSCMNEWMNECEPSWNNLQEGGEGKVSRKKLTVLLYREQKHWGIWWLSGVTEVSKETVLAFHIYLLIGVEEIDMDFQARKYVRHSPNHFCLFLSWNAGQSKYCISPTWCTDSCEVNVRLCHVLRLIFAVLATLQWVSFPLQ